MRSNSGLWLGVIGGGVLVAGLVVTVGVIALANWSPKKVAQKKETAPTEPAKAAPLTAPTQPAERPAPLPAKADKELSPVELWNRADVRESAEEIFNGYQGNALAADQKYKGKWVATYGAVLKVDSLPDGPVVILKAGEFAEFGQAVWCHMARADTDKLTQLVDGNAVAVVGQGKGKNAAGVITIEKCRLVHAAKDLDELRKAFK